VVAKLRIDTKELQDVLDKVEESLGGDVKPVWREFAQYMRTVTDKTFRALRHGGTYRGVTWKYFAPQYRRKTDGVLVPAAGGVPKIHGKGQVKGRKRPSGKRVKPGDSVMQDNNVLRPRAALVVRMSPKKLTLGPQGVLYAGFQHRLRPFLFFTPKDAQEAVKIAVRRLHKTAVNPL